MRSTRNTTKQDLPATRRAAHCSTVHSPTRFSSRPPFHSGGHAKVHHLHGWEKLLLVFAGALLVFQPWALGGMRLWSQYIAAALALIAFIAALIPRRYTDRHHAGGDLRLIMWPKLLRFPFFWLGLVYFGLVLIQLYNPAWQFFRLGAGWAVLPISHVTWLPHGVAGAPIEMMNGWRTLLIQVTPWLLVCALWVGITRRKSIRTLLTLMAVNGTAVALVVLLQRLTGTRDLLWFYDVRPAYYFAASFIYKNHAGAFLVLTIATCLGLAWWHMVRAERELRKSHPGVIFVFMALVAFTGLAFTYARVATALGALLFLVFSALYGRRLYRIRSSGTASAILATIAVVACIFLAVIASSLNTDKLKGRFAYLLTETGWFHAVTVRQLSTKATVEMAKDSIWVGHGAGSYRYVFPKYQRNHPEIWMREFPQGKNVNIKRLFWEYTHNDYAQFLAESGLIGVLLATGTFVLILVVVRRDFVWRQPALLLLLAGPGLVAVNAWVDFPAHNPAILVGACGVTVLSLRWAALGRKGT